MEILLIALFSTKELSLWEEGTELLLLVEGDVRLNSQCIEQEGMARLFPYRNLMKIHFQLSTSQRTFRKMLLRLVTSLFLQLVSEPSHGQAKAVSAEENLCRFYAN